MSVRSANDEDAVDVNALFYRAVRLYAERNKEETAIQAVHFAKQDPALQKYLLTCLIQARGVYMRPQEAIFFDYIDLAIRRYKETRTTVVSV